MKYEYLRIDDFTLLNKGVDSNTWSWLNQLPDVEYRNDYCCHFVLRGSSSHTAIAMKLGDVFES